MEKFIIHIDMDAFFAAVEQRDNPALRGKPVIVGADPKGGKGRGVVCACSYEARKFGISSGMPISIAYRKCPRAVFLPVDMEKYSRLSLKIFDLFYSFTPEIEGISIDEAFLDISGSYHIFGTPLETCRLLKSRIKTETGLTASVGLAPTKMAAKIASDLKKPDGLVAVTRQGLLDFLRPLDIEKIWGLGKKSKVVLNKMGIKTIGELAGTDLKKVVDVLGKNGGHLWQLANGIDEREVETDEERQSISNEVTFAEDIRDREKIEGFLIGLCEKVSGRLRRENIEGRTITLKIRLEGFHTYTRSKTLLKTTNFVDTIYQTAKRLFNNFNLKGRKIRLIGIKVSNLDSRNGNESLFNDIVDEKKERIHQAVDKIKEKFGEAAIRRAASQRRVSN
ncbi:MAG: DNA polymerase IV [Candidatus Ratteibacteria bacterium]|nr:DNA polymerase IV [Candidatus Ratteibacteria bacterium]